MSCLAIWLCVAVGLAVRPLVAASTTPPAQLYLLSQDPGETRKLAGEQGRQLQELQGLLQKVRAAGCRPQP
jgi:hypothetical protein